MKPLALIVFLVIAVVAILAGPGCANVIPPQGGPRDSLPPRILKISTPDSSVNFTGNRITFTFDEFVEVQNIQENLMVSPIPRITPALEYRLNTVTLRLKDSLEPNTTYSFNFGKAVRDVNEGNPLPDFNYTFSTGSYLDSLQLAGKVILAETGRVDTSLIVMLHTSPVDSAVVTEKPRYVTKLDGRGNFIFRNLPSKMFYIYALKDEGGSMRYFNERQLFAFADKPVIAGKDSSITLYAYAVKAATIVLPPAPVGKIGKRQTDNLIDSRLRYQTSLLENKQDMLSPFYLSFDLPLRSFDSSRISLSMDSVFTPVTGYRFVKDSSGKKIELLYTLKENTSYNIILEKDFAEDTMGKKLLKTDTIRFITKKLSDYGSLKLRLRNLNLSGNPVLMIMQNDIMYKSYALSGNEITEPVFLPGEYELRILYDENKNGKWDPGEFFGKHKQPERVIPIERKITVKPSAPNEFEVSL